MSDLTSIEKLKLEKLFEMGGGYVLDFSNATFREFVLESTDIDIYDEKYNYQSGSKANRLRAFWKKGSNSVVGNLLESLFEYWKAKRLLNNQSISLDEQQLLEACYEILARVKKGVTVKQNGDSLNGEQQFLLSVLSC
jgi:hypothetical protein